MDSNDNNNDSYSDESDSNTKSDSDTDTESETNEQPDDDDKNGLIDDSYKGPDFEPKPFKLETSNKDNNRHGQILTNHEHQPNPTVVIDENVEATVDVPTPNVEPSVELRRSTHERRELWLRSP